MPGTTASVEFSFSRGAPSPPMFVHMAECVPGSYRDEYAKLCRACAAGKYSTDAGQTVCVDCALGTYVATAGASACFDCPSGLTASLVGQTTCTPCDAGMQSTPDRTACTYCAPGEFSAAAGSTCTKCEASKYQSRHGSTECIRCPAIPPTYSLLGAENCTTCHDGASAPPLHLNQEGPQ